MPTPTVNAWEILQKIAFAVAAAAFGWVAKVQTDLIEQRSQINTLTEKAGKVEALDARVQAEHDQLRDLGATINRMSGDVIEIKSFVTSTYHVPFIPPVPRAPHSGQGGGRGTP